MSTNLGKVSQFPNLQPSAAKPAVSETALDGELPGSFGHGREGGSNSRADCPCRICRKARRQAREIGLSPIEKLELVPEWKRAIVLAAFAAFVVLLFAGIVDFAAGLAAVFAR